jgi:hypothetical protein
VFCDVRPIKEGHHSHYRAIRYTTGGRGPNRWRDVLLEPSGTKDAFLRKRTTVVSERIDDRTYQLRSPKAAGALLNNSGRPRPSALDYVPLVLWLYRSDPGSRRQHVLQRAVSVRHSTARCGLHSPPRSFLWCLAYQRQRRIVPMVEQWSPKPKVKGSNPFSPDLTTRIQSPFWFR